MIGPLKVGNMKIDTHMETKSYKISDSGYNPKIQITTGAFSTKYFHENSAVKNTTAEIMKNRTITISNTIKKIVSKLTLIE